MAGGSGSVETEKGLKFQRFFTTEGISPYDALEWERRTASIASESGGVIFEQHDVEVPKDWSQTATNIVASKYFHGQQSSPQRESSVRMLISRVTTTMRKWGLEGGYFQAETDADCFHDELSHLLLNQMVAFNSPVWFNCGVEEKPQCSACFINSVEDTMSSILSLAKTEAMLFKWGSGTGSNLSPIRSSIEQLSGGGIASGPVSFMKGFDAFAGVIKSGGKTRRAAKMVILNVDHPDIIEFINSKSKEEKKAWVLLDNGYEGGVDGDAYGSIFFPERQPQCACHGRFHASGRQRRKVDDTGGHDGRAGQHLPGAGNDDDGRRIELHLRRSRHAVRFERSTAGTRVRTRLRSMRRTRVRSTCFWTIRRATWRR